MAPYPYYQTNAAYNPSSQPIGGIMAAGLVGAAITGTIAAARGLREVQDGAKEPSRAVVSIAKEALGGGVALAAGAAVAKTLFHSSRLGFVAMLAVGIGAKYTYDSLTAKVYCDNEKDETVSESPKPAKAVKKAQGKS